MDAFAVITIAAAGVGFIAGCVQVTEYLERKRHPRANAAAPLDRADVPLNRAAPHPHAGEIERQGAPVTRNAREENNGAHSETVSFLFTDIEGSTALWMAQPDAMRRDLPRHNALLRAEVEKHGGQVFKTVGDACHAVFAAPHAAVQAALDAQTALRRETWSVGTMRVRMALHVCEAEARGGDYFGAGLSRVSRLRDAAHGGQTLVSETAWAVLEVGLPDGAVLHSWGAHRLKDLLRPEVIYELRHPALPEEFSPPRSLSVMPNNLPAQMTSFVGRAAEMDAVQSLLRGGTHLLTLTGPGGCGKTRLALQAAAELLSDYPDGVWMADLSALSDPTGITPLVAGILNVRTDRTDVTEAICQSLEGSRLLLILDNCEHLLDAAARFATALLREVPGVRILATSREDLGVDGEHMYSVPPLLMPGTNDPATSESVGKAESVRLFVERARAGGGTFVLSDGNADAVARICRRLDGLPLAIELAGARARTLSAEQIDERLEDRFRLLTGGFRTAPHRQQTLRATIDWSYELLADDERALFAQLSVFVSGWTLEAAEAVCIAAGQGGDRSEVLDILSHLVDKSLVTVGEGTPETGTRFRLLETLRVYSLEHPSDNADALRVRHRDFYTDLAAQAEPHLRGPEQVRWLRVLDTEHDNLRVALCASDTAGRLRIGMHLHKFWLARGFLAEGRGWLDEALSAPDSASVDSSVRAAALSASGVLAWAANDLHTAAERQTAALALWRRLQNAPGEALTLKQIGIVADYCDDYTTARVCYEDSLAIFRHLKDVVNVASVLVNLGAHCIDRAQWDEAVPFLEESLTLRRTLGDAMGEAVVLHDLGQVAQARGDAAGAEALFSQSLTLRREAGDRRGMAQSLLHLALTAQTQEESERAARLLGASEAAHILIGTARHDFILRHQEDLRHSLTDALGGSSFAEAYRQGRSMTTEEAVVFALRESSSF